jgi:hypothetical protein
MGTSNTQLGHLAADRITVPVLDGQEEGLPPVSATGQFRIVMDSADNLLKASINGAAYFPFTFAIAAGNTLDQAYDTPAPGLGRVITVDAGAVEMNTPLIEDVALLTTGLIRNDGSGSEYTGASTLAVSAANEGRIRYNEVTQTFQISENTLAYRDLGGADSLQEAYDRGGAGLGRTIDISGAALPVAISNIGFFASELLTITQDPGAADVPLVVVAGGAPLAASFTGAPIDCDGGAGGNTVTIGPAAGPPAGAGAGAVVLGLSAVGDGDSCVAIGESATVVAGNLGAVCVGDTTTCGDALNPIGGLICVGRFATAGTTGPGNSSMAIGDGALVSTAAPAQQAIAIGTGASSQSAFSIALGPGCTVEADASDGIAMGSTSTVGDGANASQFCISIGAGCAASTFAGIASGTIAIGNTAAASTTAAAPRCIAIGNAASAQHDDAIAFGSGATTTVANQCVLGDVGVNGITLLTLPGDAANNLGTAIEMTDGSGQADSSLNEGRIIYNAVTQTFQISTNNTPYTDLIRNTLDLAYDQGGAGAGRTITADSGAVEIDVAGANDGLQIDLDQANQAAIVVNLSGAVADTVAMRVDDAATGVSVANLITVSSDGAADRSGAMLRLAASANLYSGNCLDIDYSGSNTATQGAVITDNGSGIRATAWVEIVNANAATAAAGAGVLRVDTTGAVGAGAAGIQGNDAIVIPNAGHGIVLTAPLGAFWRVTIDDAGVVQTTAL